MQIKIVDLKKYENKKIKIFGFIRKTRNFGDLLFVDVEDFSEKCQIVVSNTTKLYFSSNDVPMEIVDGFINEENEKTKTIEKISSLTRESYLEVIGEVKKRRDINQEMITGNFEIIAESIKLISKATTPPLIIEDNTDALEDIRLEYRYLDLRRPIIQKNLKMRHHLSQVIRNFLDTQSFIEVETPILSKSTPEGARDYLVPSRVNPKEFFALPQSPQVYKQLLMIAGYERYYQIARCFRDEDLRQDRQPEFTQLDIEQANINEADIMKLIEQLMITIFKQVKDISIPPNFKTIEYYNAMEQYGSDKPDTRFGLNLIEVTNIFSKTNFKVFSNVSNIKVIIAPNSVDVYSRKEIEKLEENAKQNGASGLAWAKFIDNQFTGGISKFLDPNEVESLVKVTNIKNGDTIFFAAGDIKTNWQVLGSIRLKVAAQLNLIPENQYNFIWITNWPLFEYDINSQKYFAMHHPFTAISDINDYENIETAQARAYDLILNGSEIGGGSIRITNNFEQRKMFQALGMNEAEYERDFGFLLKAYQYGAPSHGGIALGIDRLVMILTESKSIRDVIAFPKNNKARDVMMAAPSQVSVEQLSELGLTDSKNYPKEQ